MVERLKLCPFCTLDHFLKNWSVTFSLFWHEPSQGSTTQIWILLNRSKGHFFKGLNLPLFSNIDTYFGMKLPQDGDNEM